MKIVVIDDSSVQRKMIQNILKKAGFNHEVMEADNGKTAIELLGSNHQDVGLILCDWNMPVMDGYEFLVEASKNEDISSIPIMMVTTQGTEDNIKQAHEAYSNLAGYIVKPFSPSKLKDAITKFLKK